MKMKNTTNSADNSTVNIASTSTDASSVATAKEGGALFRRGDKTASSISKRIARTAVIAALYACLTYVNPLSYGAIQFRISEALTVLPLFYVEAIPALAIGCLLANVLSTPWDMLLGTLATLIAAVATHYSRKVFIGIIWPVIANAFTVPAILALSGISYAYWFNVLTVGCGELAVVCVLGIPLYYAFINLRKKHAFMR